LDEAEQDIQNYLDRGQCYLPQPSASADNIDRGLTQIILVSPAQAEFNNCFIIHFVTERKQNTQQLKTNKYSLN
jgi:hypothetical protein